MAKRNFDVLFRGYLSLVGAFLLYVGIGNMREHDPWGMGDWLTNYAGGFVRRGLLGEFTLYLSHHSPHVSVYVWTLAMQLACYAMIFRVILFLLHDLAWNPWMIAMVYSPATLSFTVFDPLAGFRKEVLYFALLATIILLLSTARAHLTLIAAFLALSMPALILTHEALLLYCPYILCAFLIALRNARQAFLLCLPGAVSGLCAFVAATEHPGGIRAARAICSAVGVNDLTDPPCSGAIIYMTKTPAMAHRDVLEAASYWHFKWMMPFLLVMALGPVVAGMTALWRDKGSRFECWSLAICSVSSWLLTIVLFVYAFDWNRWVYIHVFSSLMLMMMIEKRRQQTNPAVQGRILPRKTAPRYATVMLLAISVVGWQLSFYHHFPLPGDKLAFYLKSKIKRTPLREKLVWHLPPDSSS